jgi:aryl-alcohol dehydrogenase-like predicted oxidoreductase
VVGRAIGSRADKPFVFTKCSRVPGPNGTVQSTLRRDVLRRECEESLRRLGVDRIDLYQLHWPRPPEELEESWETLARLREEGKVRWIGVSNFDVAQLERARKIAPVTSLGPPGSARLGEIGARHGVTAAVVALAWVLRDPAVTAAIVGARGPQQVDGFIPAMELRLSPEESGEIAAFL